MTPSPPDENTPLPASWDADETDLLATERKSKKVWIIAGIVVVLLAVAAAVVVISKVLEPTERAWPANTGGRPAGLGEDFSEASDIVLGAEPGIYIWQGFDGWHLWVVNGGEVSGVRGTVTSSDDIKRAAPSGNEGATASSNGKVVDFDLSGDVPVAGVDIDAGFSQRLEFDLQGLLEPIDPSVVFIGKDLTPATSNPVVIVKAEVD